MLYHTLEAMVQMPLGSTLGLSLFELFPKIKVLHHDWMNFLVVHPNSIFNTFSNKSPQKQKFIKYTLQPMI